MWRFLLYCWVVVLGIGLAATPFLPLAFLCVPMMWHWVKVGKFD